MDCGTYIVEKPLVSWLDYPDDESLAVVWYLSGCDHNCFNCHNKELQQSISKDSILMTIEDFFEKSSYYCEKNKTNKIVLEGGDPLYNGNLLFTKEVLTRNKKFDICIYTGYELGFVKENNITGFSFLKTGLYIEKLKQKSEKNDEYMSLASTNQKIYNKNCDLLSEAGKYYWRNYV